MNRKLFLTLFLSGLNLIAFTQTKNLEFYLKEALQNSPLLNEYRNKANAATEDSLLISAAKKPFIEARSQLLYSPFYRNFGYDEVITDGGSYSAVMGVSQNIFNKKELENRYSSAGLQKTLAINSSKITENEINKLITNQYLISYSGYQDYLFNKKFLELFEKENQIVNQFVKSGIGKQTDYLALLVETQSQEILTGQLKSEFRKNLLQLNRLCGITDSSLVSLDDPKLGITGKADITISPSFLQYKIDSVRIENEKLAIDLRYRLKVNWFADAGILTSNPSTFYRHFGYSAGIGLNIPVYDGKQREIEKRKLDFEENSRRMYEDTYHKQYFQQIQQMSEELKALDEMSERIEKQLKTSDQLVTVLKDQLEAGIIQMTEYINAIKNFKNINRNLNLINMQKLQVINEMNYITTQ